MEWLIWVYAVLTVLWASLGFAGAVRYAREHKKFTQIDRDMWYCYSVAREATEDASKAPKARQTIKEYRNKYYGRVDVYEYTHSLLWTEVPREPHKEYSKLRREAGQAQKKHLLATALSPIFPLLIVVALLSKTHSLYKEAIWKP